MGGVFGVLFLVARCGGIIILGDLHSSRRSREYEVEILASIKPKLVCMEGDPQWLRLLQITDEEIGKIIQRSELSQGDKSLLHFAKYNSDMWAALTGWDLIPEAVQDIEADIEVVDFPLQEKHELIDLSGMQDQLDKEIESIGRHGEHLPLSAKMGKLIQSWWANRSPRLANTSLGISLFDETRFLKKYAPTYYAFSGALRNRYMAAKTLTLHRERNSSSTCLIMGISHVQEVTRHLRDYTEGVRNPEYDQQQLELPPEELVKSPDFHALLDIQQG